MANLVEFVGACTLWFMLCCGIGTIAWFVQEVKKTDVKVAKVLNSRTIRYVRASTLERVIYVFDGFTMLDRITSVIMPLAAIASLVVLLKYYIGI